MNIEYLRNWSPNLNQDMEIKIFGQAGKPVLVFPALSGRFFDFENFGMIHAVHEFIERGQFQFFCVDSIDRQSWENYALHPADRARRHEDYDRYITQEVVPLMHEKNGSQRGILTTGASMGGYHAANFFFRHPDAFDAVISLSGMFQLRPLVGDYMDETVYFNTPLAFLPNLEDAWYLERYQRADIILCCGQGAWEEDMVTDHRAIREILERKGIPAWVDMWGYDVNHDWPWWRLMLPYYLQHLLEAWESRSQDTVPGL